MTKPVLKAAICVAGGVQEKMASGSEPDVRDEKDVCLTSLLLSWLSWSWVMVNSSPEAASADV